MASSNEDPEFECVTMVGMPLEAFKQQRAILLRTFYWSLGCGALLGAALVLLKLGKPDDLYIAAAAAGAAIGSLSMTAMSVGKVTQTMQTVIEGASGE